MWKDWLENEPKITLLCAVTSGVSLILSLAGVFRELLPLDVAWIAIVLCGIPILLGAIRGLVFDHDIKADVLVAMALVASVATGEYFAAGEVALIMQIGSLLEDYTSGKAKKGIEKLIRLTPQTAHVIRNGMEMELPAEQVRVHDVVRVLAGETIPVDGTILAGETTIDQSVMTGESIPVDKKAGDPVNSGTVNQFGTFTMRAEKVSTNSSLQRMVRLAKEAEGNKAPVVTMADRFATWLVLAALICAVVTFAVTGEFIRAVTVLVVFCPCAFILATPTAILAGIGNAAKYGIIVRSGDALERISRIKRVAFDKTGTLTCGRLEVAAVVSVDTAYTKDEIFRLAALTEQYSEHPLGKAIVRSYLQNENGALSGIADFKVTAGQGITAVVDGKRVLVGKADFMKAHRIAAGADTEADIGAEQWYRQGATVVFLAIEGKMAGFVALSDTPRADAADTIKRLKKVGITPMLLTGDHETAAESIAAKVGITDIYANLLPEEKMDIIHKFAGSREPIGMVGDGVNDALALGSADAGIAMGGIGSDIVIESADAVLVSDDIKRLPYLFGLMKKVMRKVKINIIASMCINITAVVLSVLGILTPVTGAIWHNFGSVFVVVNAALLLGVKDDAAE